MMTSVLLVLVAGAVTRPAAAALVFVFRLIVGLLLQDPGVGKTSITARYVWGNYNSTRATIG